MGELNPRPTDYESHTTVLSIYANTINLNTAKACTECQETTQKKYIDKIAGSVSHICHTGVQDEYKKTAVFIGCCQCRSCR